VHVLVLGSGGREHALCWAIARSPQCEQLLCAPGNAGIAPLATCIDLDICDGEAVLAACRERGVNLLVIGPEAPLVAGVADVVRAGGVDVFGPGAAAARLEGSKAWAKAFMARHGVPTAAYDMFDDADALAAHLQTCPLPTVVKADGLAAGKGVVVAFDRATALAAGQEIAGDKRFGAAGDVVVVEEFLPGEEATVFALLDGESVVVLPASQDHKRRFDGDQGPNTGGMGAYTPVPAVTAAVSELVRRTVLEPMARGLRAEGIPYRGVLYAGLMLTPDGPKVVEFNVRFGDPECQPLVVSLATDLLVLLAASARGELAQAPPVAVHDGATLCVVLVSDGYPGAYDKGLPISGLDAAAAVAGVEVFHAGTRRDGDRVVTAGGRVLGVTARGEMVEDARARAYEAAAKIQWTGRDYRTDVGHRALGET